MGGAGVVIGGDLANGGIVAVADPAGWRAVGQVQVYAGFEGRIGPEIARQERWGLRQSDGQVVNHHDAGGGGGAAGNQLNRDGHRARWHR